MLNSSTLCQGLDLFQKLKKKQIVQIGVDFPNYALSSIFIKEGVVSSRGKGKSGAVISRERKQR